MEYLVIGMITVGAIIICYAIFPFNKKPGTIACNKCKWFAPDRDGSYWYYCKHPSAYDRRVVLDPEYGRVIEDVRIVDHIIHQTWNHNCNCNKFDSRRKVDNYDGEPRVTPSYAREGDENCPVKEPRIIIRGDGDRW